MENELTTTNEMMSKGDKMIIEITDSNFESEVLQTDKTVIVHFSLESEHDSKMIPILDELLHQYLESVKFGKIKMTEQPVTASKYGVSMAPTLLIFVYGKVVAQIVGAVPKDTIKIKLDTVIGKPSEELPELTLNELKKAYKQYNGDWNNAVFSGLVAGIVFAIARRNFQGAGSLIIPGLAMAFFIQNKNFRFSWLQKGLAIVIMFIIGMFNQEIIELIKQWVFTK
jgi:thioredoxin 1